MKYFSIRKHRSINTNYYKEVKHWMITTIEVVVGSEQWCLFKLTIRWKRRVEPSEKQRVYSKCIRCKGLFIEDRLDTNAVYCSQCDRTITKKTMKKENKMTFEEWSDEQDLLEEEAAAKARRAREIEPKDEEGRTIDDY